jgi:hypothetical protein
MEKLAKARIEAACAPPTGPPATKFISGYAPDAIILDLGRLPSHSRWMAVALRRRKQSRHIPLVLTRGEPDKVAQTKSVIPDAVYTDWNSVVKVLRDLKKRALLKRPLCPPT